MSFTAPSLKDADKAEAAMRLGRIEAEEGITILIAVESGSRAWGFPSPDSDFDVRFIYTRQITDYLAFKPSKDVITRPIDGVWDLEGWDIRKAMSLLAKGNATVAEWLQSPLIYREHGPFPYRLRDLIKRHASTERSIRHYYGLTKTCYNGEMLNRMEVNYKKYFYAVRGAMAIAWIRAYKEIPPMTLPELMSTSVMPDKVRAEVERLERVKATMSEVGRGPRIDVLDAFILDQIAFGKHGTETELPDAERVYDECELLMLEALGV